ncbi:hypothetical protein [Halobacteriovorax sp. HLS]|uniref:hypothetical protein n=1 Tax=Halobacteriovorax sp. HLS TaxID=2234000 RepID=UPI000FDC7B16|nr:hypothetical protein [Halobacteriovorax sp. HLS]
MNFKMFFIVFFIVSCSHGKLNLDPLLISVGILKQTDDPSLYSSKYIFAGKISIFVGEENITKGCLLKFEDRESRLISESGIFILDRDRKDSFNLNRIACTYKSNFKYTLQNPEIKVISDKSYVGDIKLVFYDMTNGSWVGPIFEIKKSTITYNKKTLHLIKDKVGEIKKERIKPLK